MTFAVSESSTDQYQRGAGGTGVGVEVGSGVKVAVAVFSAGWDVEVETACSMGAEVDTAGLAQADRNMTIANIGNTIRLMVPLLHIKVTVTMNVTVTLDYCSNVLHCTLCGC